jgi:hypothetical protein
MINEGEYNVELDFTGIKQASFEPVAVMPTALAKKLLKMYADKLVNASTFEIVSAFKAEIHPGDDSVEDVMNKCTLFVQERQLIENCAKGNWNAYTTPAFYVEPLS